jgi:5-methylthioadenosine/S-adenosylhomocysteine deaminase
MSSLLINHATLWPSADSDPVPDGSLYAEDGVIRKLGPSVEAFAADTVIDAKGNLVMPGLIQTHVHLCQTIFRGIAEDLPLLPWLREFIWPMEAAHDPVSLAASVRLSAAEMIRSGTTAFMSMETVRHTDAVVDALRETGLYGLVCHCLMDETAGYEPLAVSVSDGLDHCRALIVQAADDPRIEIGVAPRFALSCSEESMKAACAFAREKGLMLHTHASEQVEEIQLVRERTGRLNVEYLHDVGLTGTDVGLAHCVHTEDSERRILKETDTRVLHCPSANLKLASGVAPVPEYLDMGLTVSLGADGAPCNNRMDNLMEMREAALIQKLRLGPEALSARDVVKMATEHGATTLRQDKRMGKLAEGMAANLIMFDSNSLHVIPSEDPATNVVYAHEASDVVLNVVDGKVLYRDGEFTTIDISQLTQDVKLQRKHLETRAGLRS